MFCREEQQVVEGEEHQEAGGARQRGQEEVELPHPEEQPHPDGRFGRRHHRSGAIPPDE